MTKLYAIAGLALTLVCQSGCAHDMTGQWQGTLHAASDQRIILQVSKSPTGEPSAVFYNIDQSIDPAAVDPFTPAETKLAFTVPSLEGSFEGVLADDGKSIKGTWSQGAPLPLDLAKTSKATAWAIDPSPHKVSFVTASDDVKLEVLDWGGTGRPLFFVTGLGATAHVFDAFVAQLTPKYHVYGVTRRGYGASDKPDPATGGNYTADRLGNDVLEVIDALKLDRPVMVGWSLAGEELSWIASHHPEKVSGLIYLDAAYGYGFYAPGNMAPPGYNLTVDLNDLRTKIAGLSAPGITAAETSAMIDRLIADDLPQLEADLRALQQAFNNAPQAGPPAGPPPPDTLERRIGAAVMAGGQKFTDLKAPVLAIFAAPHAPPPNLPEAMRGLFEMREAMTEAQIKRFETGNPTAKVVRMADAQHAVFTSNPADVLRAMIAFIDGLK
jgi:non-heme chloroperoxidase